MVAPAGQVLRPDLPHRIGLEEPPLAQSPWIEERTPNQGSTCIKGRFGYDFPQHRDRLTRNAARFAGKRAVWASAPIRPAFA